MNQANCRATNNGAPAILAPAMKNYASMEDAMKGGKQSR